MREALGSGEALATDAAEYLVEKGVPFREAHEAVGAAAAHATRTGQGLAELAATEWRRFHRAFGPDVKRRFDPAASLARREIPGRPRAEAGRSPARALGTSSSGRRREEGCSPRRRAVRPRLRGEGPAASAAAGSSPTRGASPIPSPQPSPPAGEGGK